MTSLGSFNISLNISRTPDDIEDSMLLVVMIRL